MSLSVASDIGIAHCSALANVFTEKALIFVLNVALEFFDIEFCLHFGLLTCFWKAYLHKLLKVVPKKKFFFGWKFADCNFYRRSGVSRLFIHCKDFCRFAPSKSNPTSQIIYIDSSFEGYSLEFWATICLTFDGNFLSHSSITCGVSSPGST